MSDVVEVSTNDEPREYMAIRLKSFHIGKPYSKDPHKFSRERQGTVSVQVGKSAPPCTLGWEGHHRFRSQTVILEEPDKFRNALVYIGPSEHVNMEVIVKETDNQVREKIKAAGNFLHHFSNVAGFGGTVAGIAPHPYAQAGSLALGLVSSASEIAAASTTLALGLVDDDVEFHCVRGVHADQGEFTLQRPPKDVDGASEDDWMRLEFEVTPFRASSKFRAVQVVIERAVLHSNTFGDDEKKQLELTCKLGTGEDEKKSYHFTQRLSQGRGATLDCICQIEDVLVTNLTCKTGLVPLAITAAVQSTAEVQLQRKALAKFLTEAAPHLKQATDYAYKLYGQLKTAELEKKREELKRLNAETVDAARTARIKELDFVIENLKKPKGSLDGFTYDLQDSTNDALAAALELGTQTVDQIMKEHNKQTMADWMETHLLDTTFNGWILVKFEQEGILSVHHFMERPDVRDAGDSYMLLRVETCEAQDPDA